MTPIKSMLFVSTIVVLLPVSAFSEPSECRSSRNDTTIRELLINLYNSALVAEYAFNESGDDLNGSCSAIADVDTVPIDELTREQVPSADDASYWVDVLADYSPYVYSASGEGYTHYYLTCRQDLGLPALAFRFLTVIHSFSETAWLSIETAAIVPETHAADFKASERIEVQYIASAQQQGQNAHRAFLVRGTQFEDLFRNLFALWNEYRDSGNSCSFDLATQVANRILDDHRFGSFDLIGSSLGGAAVQSVITDSSFLIVDSLRYVHSFNSPGSTSPSVDPKLSQKIVSFCGDNDFACVFAMSKKRSQIGTTVTNYPVTQSLTSVGDVLLALMGGVLSVDFENHFIDRVRENICDCLDGEGKIEMSPPAP